MNHSSAGMGAIVYATQPLMLALIAHRVLDERLTPQRVLGLVLGFGGVIVVMTTRIGTGHSDSLLGTALNLGSVISLTLGAIVFKRFTPLGSNVELLSVQHAISSAFLVPLVFMLEDPWHITINASLTGSIFYLVIFGSLIGPLIWQVMLTRGEATVFTSYYFLTPILGLLFATLFLSEEFTLHDAVGLALTVAGITLVARSPTKALAPVPGGRPRAARKA
jgi:drug/metabolite transporter (DMT)-like permease